MRIHTFGAESAPVVIMLPGSFCNADTMANIITRLEREFHILAVDYNGQYAGSEKSFTSRRGEAEEIIRYIQGHAISSVALVYGQSMGGEMGMELLAQLKKNGITAGGAFFDGGPFLRFPKVVSKLLGSKFKTIVGNLRGKTLEEALKEPTIVKFSGGKPERYSNMLGPSAWRFCHRKLQKAYPFAQYKLVSGYGHVGYPAEHLDEYCAWLSAAARGGNTI